MKRALFLSLLALVCLLVACDNPITESIKKHIVMARLNAALDEMPKSPEFDVAKVYTFASNQNEKLFQPGCYVAQGVTVVGSSLSIQDAMDNYFRLVQVNHWTPRADQYEDSKVLSREPNEDMNITATYPGSDVVPLNDYTRFQQTYKCIIYANVTESICQ